LPGLKALWEIVDVTMVRDLGEVRVRVALPAKTRWVYPDCLKPAPMHDHQERRWRHLDTCQYRTVVVARVPRLSCPEHGSRRFPVPWAEPGSRFTALFEALAIVWLKQASIEAVAKRLRLSWGESASSQACAVERVLARRVLVAPKYVSVDKTSLQRRHEYVTVVSDLEKPQVLHVADDRAQASQDELWTGLPREQPKRIEAVAMDMCVPHIQSALLNVPAAVEKIVFDKFHIAQLLNKAVDQIRRRERFRMGTYFNCGGLALYPSSLARGQ
ncbi:MAG: transposase, partial [Devosia sp.]